MQYGLASQENTSFSGRSHDRQALRNRMHYDGLGITSNHRGFTGIEGDTSHHPGDDNIPQWMQYFGHPERPLHVNPETRYSRTVYDLPEAFKGSNPHLTNILIRMITGGMIPEVVAMLPWKKHEGGRVIAWDVWKFDDHMMGRTPEEATSRLLTSETSSGSDSTVRYGIALLLEHGFFKTEKGRMNYRMNLIQIKNAVLETACFGAIMAVLNSPLHEDNFHRHLPGGQSDFNDTDNIIRQEVRNWGIIQKEEMGLSNILHDASQALIDRDSSSGGGNYTMVPAGCQKYANARPENKWYYLKGGNATVPSSYTRDSHLIRESRGYRIKPHAPVYDPAFRKQAIGGFAYMGYERVKGIPGEEFRTAMYDIIMYDENKDEMVKISYQDILLNYSGLFDSGSLSSPIGEEYFAGYDTWGQYFDKRDVFGTGTTQSGAKRLWKRHILPKLARSDTGDRDRAAREWIKTLNTAAKQHSVDAGRVSPAEQRQVDAYRRRGGRRTFTAAAMGLSSRGRSGSSRSSSTSARAVQEQQQLTRLLAIVNNLSSADAKRIFLTQTFNREAVLELAKYVTTARYTQAQQEAVLTMIAGGGPGPVLAQMADPAYAAPYVDEHKAKLSRTGMTEDMYNTLRDMLRAGPWKTNAMKAFLAHCETSPSDDIQQLAEPDGDEKHDGLDDTALTHLVNRVVWFILTKQKIMTDHAPSIRNLAKLLQQTAPKLVDRAGQTLADLANVGPIASNDLAAIAPTATLAACKTAFVQAMQNLSIRENVWLVEFLLEEDVPVGISLFLFRPNKRYEMGSGFHMEGNGAAGNTFVGHSDMQLSDNVQQKMHYGHYTVYMKSIIHTPRKIVHLRNIFCRQYLGGNSTRFWNPLSRSDYAMYRGLSLRGAPSMFACAVPYKEELPDRHYMDITGQFHESLGPRDENRGKHYSTAEIYGTFWGWQHGENSNLFNRDYKSEITELGTTIVFQEHQQSYNHATKNYTTIHQNRGHWGERTYAGCASGRRGVSYLKPVSYDKTPGVFLQV